MRKTPFLAPLLAALLLSFPAAARDEIRGAAAAVKGIGERYSAVNDLRCEFTQETRVASMDEKILSSGRAWFKKPAMMRWEYEKPWKDVVVSDGKKVWYLDSRENRVTETALDESPNAPGFHAVPSMLEDLDRVFDVRLNPGSPDARGNVLLDLVPRTGRETRSVTIAVAPKTHALRKIVVSDVFGNTTVITLLAARENPGVPDSLFRFEKPKGARTATFP